MLFIFTDTATLYIPGYDVSLYSCMDVSMVYFLRHGICRPKDVNIFNFLDISALLSQPGRPLKLIPSSPEHATNTLL